MKWLRYFLGPTDETETDNRTTAEIVANIHRLNAESEQTLNNIESITERLRVNVAALAAKPIAGMDAGES